MVAGFYLVLLVALWMTREPGVAPGWGAVFVDGFVPDASPAVLLTLLAALTPAVLMRSTKSPAGGAQGVHLSIK